MAAARRTCVVYMVSEPAVTAPAIGAKVRKLRAKSAIPKTCGEGGSLPPDL